MTDSDQDSTTNLDRSSGADLNAGRDLSIGGDVMGRDKIHQHVANTTFDQRGQAMLN